jgi:hypothetical protein
LSYQEDLGYVMMVLLIRDSEFQIDIYEDLDWYGKIGLDLSELFKVTLSISPTQLFQAMENKYMCSQSETSQPTASQPFSFTKCLVSCISIL